MEVSATLNDHVDEHTKVTDTLKVSFTPVYGNLHEIKFTRASSNSRDPKVNKFYLKPEDMFELEAAIRVYNAGLVD